LRHDAARISSDAFTRGEVPCSRVAAR
jgi:hypothetical protein